MSIKRRDKTEVELCSGGLGRVRRQSIERWGRFGRRVCGVARGREGSYEYRVSEWEKICILTLTFTNVVNDKLSRSGVCITQQKMAVWSTLGHLMMWRFNSIGSCDKVRSRIISFRSIAI
jgi:hypothetical protein